MGFIYRITNLINGKKYIGETTKKDPLKRWEGHLHAIGQGKGCPLLQRAILAHGKDNFTFEVIVECDDKDRYELEKAYIKSENSLAPNGYNVLEGGPGGGFVGKTHSDETREKMRQATLKIYETLTEEERATRKENTLQARRSKSNGVITITEEHREIIRKANKGKKLSEETKQKIRENVIKQYTITPEIRKKISEAAKARPKRKITTEFLENHSKAITAALGKKVNQYSSDGKLIQTFLSKKQASEAMGDCIKAIDKSIKSGNPTRSGNIWKLADPITAAEEIPTSIYKSKTVKELKELCRTKNIQGITGKKKAELITLLETQNII